MLRARPLTNKHLVGLSFILALSTLAFGLTGSAKAATQDITVTPTSVSPVTQPGASYHGSFQVIDQGKSSYKFLVYAAPYHVSGEDYTPDFTALPTAPNITSWFNFSAAGGYIKPGQTQSFNYTINIPENTQSGGYYAAIFAETQFPKSASGVTVNERVGELVYIQAGKGVKKGGLVSWQSNFLQKPPLTSTLRLQNQGSVNFPVTIQYQVSDILGRAKYSLDTRKQLLPQTIRRVQMPWTKTPAIGLFKVKSSISYLDQRQVLSTKWVLVMSDTVRIVFLVLLLLVLAYFAGYARYRSRKKKRRYHR